MCRIKYIKLELIYMNRVRLFSYPSEPACADAVSLLRLDQPAVCRMPTKIFCESVEHRFLTTIGHPKSSLAVHRPTPPAGRAQSYRMHQSYRGPPSRCPSNQALSISVLQLWIDSTWLRVYNVTLYSQNVRAGLLVEKRNISTVDSDNDWLTL